MINELNLNEDDKGINYIRNEGSYLGIIEEDHADDESAMSDRGGNSLRTSGRNNLSNTHLSLAQ